ncbi:S24/S26 family peptidase [Proteiniborus sp. MB09-C3]|uniref:S24/S26 family peptidase n=1 Tax=Proteiniborus sp. MB09-C3 TaxID=3050072 RepID=UPI0025525414|nr:S24/S26 family peptidase [Proteiniborus sp. MB09-C3]WIV11341.1 S24/S26 family peptidase [Proteiniborus sp. MB09-C3]
MKDSINKIEYDFEHSTEIIMNLISMGFSFSFLFDGTSMLPTILPKSKIKLINPTSLKLNNIYIYIDLNSPTKRLVCHRLIDIKNNICYFKGDNRSEIDAPVAMQMIIAEVII